jgi:hypothetical protein
VTTGVDDDVAVLLEAYVEPLYALEIIVAIAREPKRLWTVPAMASFLSSTAASTLRELERLVALGLMVREPASCFRFAPDDPTKLDAVNRITEAYRRNRISVINQVASRAMKRIQALADAFRVGKKGDP